MYALPTLDDLSHDLLDGAAVFVRVDFNVPLKEGRVLDTHRLDEARPTLERLLQARARLLVASHLGRPKGKPSPELSLRPVAGALEQILGRPVAFAEDCVGEPVAKGLAALEPGDLCLLENLRFHAEEEANDEGFARALAEPATVYVNDAFGTAHRAHASVAGMVPHVPHRAAGLLMSREVEVLSGLLTAPRQPFTAILGGAKISGKIDTLRQLLAHLQRLLIAGGMANTFLVAQGHDLGRSRYEEEALDLAREILAEAEQRGIELLLPTDLVITDRLEDPTSVETVSPSEVPAESMAVDVGPETVARFEEAIASSGTIFWNGPCGVFETPPFDAGSLGVARALASAPGQTVVGGGETGAVVAQAGVAERIDHVSTGGGASLALLAGKPLPALEALKGSGAS